MIILKNSMVTTILLKNKNTIILTIFDRDAKLIGHTCNLEIQYVLRIKSNIWILIDLLTTTLFLYS